MSKPNIFARAFLSLINSTFRVRENDNNEITAPRKILIIRQHNELGHLLSSVSIFRAIKETYPDCFIRVIASPDNYFAITRNNLIDDYYVFDKRKIVKREYRKELKSVLKEEYDWVIVPVSVKHSYTSTIIARFVNTKLRIGAKSLQGIKNYLAGFYEMGIDLDWRRYPDAHVSDFILDNVRPLNISTKDFTSHISSDESALDYAEKFIGKLTLDHKDLLIGIHVGAGKKENIWPLDSYIDLIGQLKEKYPVKIYLTGSNKDLEEIDYIKKNLNIEVGYFLNKRIPALAALIEKSDLFITNDTGVMHVAGVTNTPQISVFGPSNPFNWAPLGDNKYFLKKSDLMDSIKVEDVLELCDYILSKRVEIKEDEQ